MSKNILLILCILILFALHFILEYGYVKRFREKFEEARERFFSKIDRIYYINLIHREDRKNEFLSNFPKEDWEKITRIDAVHTADTGAIGCLKSHILALERAIKDSAHPDNIVLICEDDFYIKDIFYCNRMLKWGFEVLPEWDVIMLAHNTHDSRSTEHKTKDGEEIIRIIHSATGSGYLMRASYAPKLLKIFQRDNDEYEKTKEFKSEYCNDVSWRELQGSDNWYAFRPTIGIQRPSYSDIQKGNVNYGI